MYPYNTKVGKMIEKTRLSVEDVRGIPVGATMTWQLEDGAAILSARNIIAYVQRYNKRLFTTKADFAKSTLEITRLS